MSRNALLVVLAAVLTLACSGAPGSFELDGNPVYEHATLCTNVPDLEPIIAYAEARWNEASNGRVSMTVQVVSTDLEHEDAPGGCDGVVYLHTLGANTLGWTESGVVALVPRVLEHPDANDIVTHEIGHLLLGDAYADTGHGPEHSPNPDSLMWYLSCPGEQNILADDVGRLP